MANHSMTGSALHTVTLTPASEDVVTLDRYESQVTVLIHPGGGSDPVYVTVDGTSATVGGTNCRIVWPGYALPLRVSGGSPTVIRLISAGAATYSIEA